MSRHGRSVLFLLQRCVSGRPVTLPAAIKTRGNSGLLSGGCGFIQQRTWTSTARGVCQLQSAVRSSQHRFCTKAGESSEDEYLPLPTYECKPEKKEVYIIHVKGLPWTCTVQDLLQFFSDCRIRDGPTGIHLPVDEKGKPSGQAFLEMEHEEDVSKALEKHRQYLGPRYVEVKEVTNSDAEALLQALKVAQADVENGVVRIRGLPFSSTEEDIIKFFSGLDLVENGITIVKDFKGRNSGEAFVQFSSQAEADEALKKDKEVIGNRYIEVFPSRTNQIYSSWRTRSNSGLQSAKQRNVSAQQNKPGSPQISALHYHCVHMRGLPYNASAEDIVKFFSPLVLSKIVIECPGGRLTGEATIHFRNHQDAMAAMSRDREHIGGRYIELFLNSSTDSAERR